MENNYKHDIIISAIVLAVAIGMWILSYAIADVTLYVK